jgi:hypothetical protein
MHPSMQSDPPQQLRTRRGEIEVHRAGHWLRRGRCSAQSLGSRLDIRGRGDSRDNAFSSSPRPTHRGAAHAPPHRTMMPAGSALRHRPSSAPTPSVPSWHPFPPRFIGLRWTHDEPTMRPSCCQDMIHRSTRRVKLGHFATGFTGTFADARLVTDRRPPRSSASTRWPRPRGR